MKDAFGKSAPEQADNMMMMMRGSRRVKPQRRPATSETSGLDDAAHPVRHFASGVTHTPQTTHLLALLKQLK